MSQKYPRMLYQNGDTTAEYLIVDDEAAEEVAASDGFIRASGNAPKAEPETKPAKEPEVSTPNTTPEPAADGKRGPGRPPKAK